MREALLHFFQVLQETLPAPEGCHHALTMTEDSTGAKLSLQLNLSGKMQLIHIDEGDLEKGAEHLVESILTCLDMLHPDDRRTPRVD